MFTFSSSHSLQRIGLYQPIALSVRIQIHTSRRIHVHIVRARRERCCCRLYFCFFHVSFLLYSVTRAFGVAVNGYTREESQWLNQMDSERWTEKTLCTKRISNSKHKRCAPHSKQTLFFISNSRIESSDLDTCTLHTVAIQEPAHKQKIR